MVMLKMNNVRALESSFCVEQMSLAVAGGLSMCLPLLPLAIHRSYESSYVNRTTCVFSDESHPCCFARFMDITTEIPSTCLTSVSSSSAQDSEYATLVAQCDSYRCSKRSHMLLHATSVTDSEVHRQLELGSDCPQIASIGGSSTVGHANGYVLRKDRAMNIVGQARKPHAIVTPPSRNRLFTVRMSKQT